MSSQFPTAKTESPASLPAATQPTGFALKQVAPVAAALCIPTWLTLKGPWAVSGEARALGRTGAYVLLMAVCNISSTSGGSSLSTCTPA